MDAIKKCIYCDGEEIEPIKINNEVEYLHCYECKKSYTVKETIKYWNLSPAQKVFYRYDYLRKENKDI